MDEGGEGFVNVGSAKSAGGAVLPSTVTRFYLLREHRVHGTVTGLERIRTVASIDDNLDRLLVTFKDAKVALLEWSEEVHDLLTVSIHTYERAPQLMSLESSLFRSELRVDPLSRCGALSLPKDALAILPFYQTQVELEATDPEHTRARDVPYSPSYILDLAADVDPRIRNVIDLVFLPGFSQPTVAVLFQPQQTWTGRLKEYKDTSRLFIFTLNVVARAYPVITTVEGLPYDCLSLTPCAISVGGVIITTANALIYVGQASHRIVLPVNGWPARTSDMPLPRRAADEEEEDRCLALEGSRAAFVDERTLLVIAKDGVVHPVQLALDGKTVSDMTLGHPLAQTTVPALVRRIGEDYLFVGSTVGPSVLMKTVRVEEPVVESGSTNAPAAVVDTSAAMELDDDDDIYGDSNMDVAPAQNGQAEGAAAVKTRTVTKLSLCDSLPAYGPISDMTFTIAKNGDRLVPELLAITGSGPLGGFTLFQRDLPVRVKRKLHAVGGGRGMWSLPLRQSVKVNGVPYDRPLNPFQAENDSVIVSTDVNPSPGLSRIATRGPKSDITITTRVPGTTVGAGSFFQKTAILHVMTNCIRVLQPDGSEKQVIKDLDGNMSRPKIRFCNICDPYVMIVREDDTLGLFIEGERGKIRRKDMSPMGEKTSRYIAGCFYTDTTGLFATHSTTGSAGANNGAATSTLQGVVNSNTQSQWLVLVRPQGVLEIWTLPKLNLVFSTTLAGSLQTVLTDSLEAPALSIPQDPPRKAHDLDIDQIVVAPLGESSPHPHLFVFLRSGHLAIYKIVSATPNTSSTTPLRTSTLAVKFVKVASRVYEIQRTEETEKSIIAEQKRIQRLLIPFTTSPAAGTQLHGVFFTGDKPTWILATDKGGINLHPSGHAVVHSFTACSLWESRGDFLMYTEEGPCLLEWMPNIDIGSRVPSRSIPRSRPYTKVTFDPVTGLVVAASSLTAQFASYDEDNNIVWEPDAPNVAFPTTDCSTLELISPDGWGIMDGYEFATNEFVNSIECVTLETLSTDTGMKDFIAVGTTLDRGEDLAVKGAAYIFEIVEVVPDAQTGPKRRYKLKMRCRDDAKGPVTAVCGMNGYLVSSMGQKVFVRAFDLDERLVGVAFLDVGVYVTSLRSTKNLLLIGDAVKSIWFVAFQEDPYKLVVLAKDVRQRYVTHADLFFDDRRMSIVTGDEEGVLRIFDYDPRDPDSKNGQELMCRTEFHAQAESRTSLTIARRTEDDAALPQTRLLFGSPDGSLSTLTPVDETVYKRLQLLQGQLMRSVQQVAGLNPRAFRIVRNDYVSRPLSKGILDGNLLTSFFDLPVPRQDEFTRQIGTQREVVLKDLITQGGAW